MYACDLSVYRVRDVAESDWTTWRWRPLEDHAGTIDADQIRAPLGMTSGHPQGATQS